MKTQRLLILALAALGGLILAGVVAYVQTMPKTGVARSALIPVTQDAFGGPIDLTDHTGKAFDEGAFAGKYRLIYFGFTYCPAICPTELSKITTVLNALGDKAKTIQPLFITVDPERDTVEKMKGYVTLFHPSLIGLTGTPAQIKATLKNYKIYAAKVEDPAMSDYTMDHSSFIYFIAPDGRLLHIFKMQDDAAFMEHTIASWFNESTR